MPVAELRGVPLYEGAFPRLARREVRPKRGRRRRRQRREELVRHLPEGLEMLDDARQLAGEPRVLPFGEIERGEAGDAADEVTVDLHSREYSQPLDAPAGAPYRGFRSCSPSPRPVPR